MTMAMLDSSHPIWMTLSTPDILIPPEGQGRMREQEESGLILISPGDPTDGGASIGSQGGPTAQQTGGSQINPLSAEGVPECGTDQWARDGVKDTVRWLHCPADVPRSPVTRTGASKGHVDGMVNGSLDPPNSATVLPSVEHLGTQQASLVLTLYLILCA